MDWPTIITQYAPTVGMFGVLGYLIYDRVTSGASDIRRDITNDYKERRNQQDAKIKELEDKIQLSEKKHIEELGSLANKFSALEASVAEKDKHITSLTAILQGRNPELVQLLGELKVSNQKIIDFMQKMYDKNEKDMKYQTNILEGQTWREPSVPINLLRK